MHARTLVVLCAEGHSWKMLCNFWLAQRWCAKLLVDSAQNRKTVWCVSQPNAAFFHSFYFLRAYHPSVSSVFWEGFDHWLIARSDFGVRLSLSLLNHLHSCAHPVLGDGQIISKHSQQVPTFSHLVYARLCVPKQTFLPKVTGNTSSKCSFLNQSAVSKCVTGDN